MELPQLYYSSKVLLGCLLAVALVLTSLCSCVLYLFLSRVGEALQHLFGWVFLIGFGILFAGTVLLSVRILRQLWSNTPRLTLTVAGIDSHELNIGEILWIDIKDAYLRSTGKSLLMCLVLRNTDKYLALLPPSVRRMARLNKMLGFTPISFNMTTVKVDAAEVLATVKSLALQYRSLS